MQILTIFTPVNEVKSYCPVRLNEYSVRNAYLWGNNNLKDIDGAVP